MDRREKINKVISALNDLEYKDKQEVYSKVFSLGKFSSNELNEKLVLVSLVALVTNQMRLKDPEITPLKVLLKLSGTIADNSMYYQFLEGIACIVEDALYGCTKIDTCGCKTSAEVMDKIKNLLNSWLPF